MNDNITAVWHQQERTLLENIHHTHDDMFELLQTFWHGNVLIDDKLYRMVYGGIYIISPLTVHMTNPGNSDSSDGIYTRSVIHFKAKPLLKILEAVGDTALTEYLFSERKGICFLPDGVNDHEIERLIHDIADADSKNLQKVNIAAKLLLILGILFGKDEPLITSENAAGNSGKHLITDSVLRYIRRNYDKKFTLNDISETINVSKYHLCRVFKHDTRMTVNEYITGYRIANVKNRLINSDDRIEKIACDAGFETYTHFSGVFKSHEGISPSEYRKKYRGSSF